MSRMNRVIEVNARDFDCRVEAGVTRGQLNRHLRDSGLAFTVDPGAEEATLGGMAATRASGTNAVRYGTMRDNVRSLVAVLADGRIVRTGRRAAKSAAGYDLTHLLVGSEGTLGIITELTVRLHPVAEATIAAVAPFASLRGACETVIAAIGAGLQPARIELLDAMQIAAVNRHAGLALAETPTLFIEVQGSRAAAREAMAALEELAVADGALSFERAEDEDERRRLWRARHDAYWAIKALDPGKAILATDVCVPISRLADCVTETAEDARRSGLVAPILGHVGDGNFHATPLFDATDPAQVAALEGFLHRLAERAIAMEGTCTGEHGIGQGKIAHLEAELGPALDVMRAIKRALDPIGLLNPGKIFRG
jgi:D-lactate dehydrogenase (cytochrome)